MDEAFTATLIRTDLAGVLSRSMQDTLPPLYNILLKLITDVLGYSVPVMKFTSTLPMICTLLLIVTVFRRRHGLFACCLFMLCITFMPLMLYYGVEIRMYSLGFFFATASAIYAYEVLCESTFRKWAAFTIFSVLAGYSHHFAFVTVGMVYFFLLLYYIIKDRPNIRRFLFCLLATALLYLPCLLVTLQQLKRVSGYFSMPDVTLHLFIQYALYPYTTGFRPLSLLLALLTAALFVYTLIAAVKTKQLLHMYTLFCFTIYYLVLLFGTAVSKIMTANIFVDRYLFFSCGLIWLFFSVEISYLFAHKGSLQARKWAWVSLPFVVLIGVSTYRTQWDLEYGTDPSEMIRYLDTHVKPGQGLLTYADSEALYWCLPFYAPALQAYKTEQEAANALDSGEIDTLWLAVDEGYSLPGESPGNDPPVFDGDFRFDRYHFSLYHFP